MTVTEIPCSRRNYGGLRQRTDYLVVHYTAGDGDTALDNGTYFARNAVGASAHFFVDENQIVASVPEAFAAWHCGAAAYRHPHCRNGNSIGVELCSRKDDGGYYFPEKTMARAAALLRTLMQRYGIPAANVLRHYDVTGKHCPAPFVPAQPWQRFLARLEEPMTQEEFEQKLQAYLQQLEGRAPGSWSLAARQWAEEQGLIRGDGQSLAYRRPVTREELVEILYRMKGETA